MAFAFLLSDVLPPERFNLFAPPPGVAAAAVVGKATYGTLAIIAAQLGLVSLAALVSNRMTLARLDGTHDGYDRAANRFSDCQRVLLGMVGAALAVTMVLTPWARLVRDAWGIGGLVLVDDVIIIAPFVCSLLLIWIIQYPAELKLRLVGHDVSTEPEPTEATPDNDATAALAAAKHRAGHPTGSIFTYVFDKFRHQFLIIAAPMAIIVIAKHFTDHFRPEITRAVGVHWAADSLLGCVSACVLAFAPVMLRFIWSTEPLPAGPLRARLVRICERIKLRYRNILLWHTHGLTVNAAVMGFVGPMRYILVSDALLETMEDEEIEAVFGHEAGHVRHYHLQFFMLFVLLTMYFTGGVVEVLGRNAIVVDRGMLEMIALGVLLACWLFGFGWVSRQFERQADVYGVRCVTPDIRSCVERCPIHGSTPTAGLCTSAARLFGGTLFRIADLNGIPREAPSWRHGSIQSRCELLERLAHDAPALRRFDRRLRRIKAGLILLALAGTVIAGWLYYPDLSRALLR